LTIERIKFSCSLPSSARAALSSHSSFHAAAGGLERGCWLEPVSTGGRQWHCQNLNIPAGPLGKTLSTFALDAGIALSFEPALTEACAVTG